MDTDIILKNTPLDARLQLIDFNKATPQTLKNLIQTVLDDANETLTDIESASLPTNAKEAFEKIQKFNAISETLDRYFSVLSHLNSVASNDAVRQAHHEVLPKISELGTRIGQSVALFSLYQLVDTQFDQLPSQYQNTEQKRAIEKSLQSFRLSGVALDADKKAQFADIQSKLSLASAKFADNVMDATRHFVRPLRPDELSGISENGLALLKSAAETYRAKHPEATLETEYVATLDIPM